MLQRIWERKNREDGFTLIELLIVIIILGILAAIVIFGVATFRGDSIDRACKTDKKNVDTAVAAFYSKNGAEPANIAALTGASPPYLRSAPNGTGYTISYDNGGNTADGNWTVTGNLTAGGTC